MYAGSKLNMTPLHYLSVARFNGPDAGVFLHAQLSADIAALEPGDSTYACYCSPRGQVIALLLVCRRQDEYLVAAAATLLPRILTRLRMFVLHSSLEFSADPATTVYGVGAQEGLSDSGAFIPGGSGLHYLLSESVAENNGRSGLIKAQEIRKRVTWLDPETSEKYIPQMLGFEQIGAVSFTKGCYPGQEIIARSRYLGKVKRKPLVVQVEEELFISPAERLELHRAGAWSQATVIDSAPDDAAGTLFFMVASAEPTDGPDQLRFQGRSYRCATT
jgi:hypothetical protein